MRELSQAVRCRDPVNIEKTLAQPDTFACISIDILSKFINTQLAETQLFVQQGKKVKEENYSRRSLVAWTGLPAGSVDPWIHLCGSLTCSHVVRALVKVLFFHLAVPPVIFWAPC